MAEPGGVRAAALGMYGNMGRATLKLPTYWQFDVAMARVLRFRETQSLEFRAELPGGRDQHGSHLADVLGFSAFSNDEHQIPIISRNHRIRGLRYYSKLLEHFRQRISHDGVEAHIYDHQLFIFGV